MRDKPFYINERQVAKLLADSDRTALARHAYIQLAKHRALSPERLVLAVPNGASFFIMPAHLLGQRTVTIKIARLNPSNLRRNQPSVKASVRVYDSSTGTELALIDGENLTAIRTAASSAVATDLLAPSNCEILGVIGTGEQARAHVPALLEVRKFSEILVYSRSRNRRTRFAKDIQRTFDTPIVPVESAEKVASSSQVIVTATNSQTPLFKGGLVQPGAHLNAIGSALPTTREVDTALVARSFIAVDSKSQALSTYGDIMIPIREGRITRNDITELGELLIHPKSIRRKPGDTSLFKSGGLAVLDAMFANHVLSKAKSQCIAAKECKNHFRRTGF